jgi:hypothetical protein
MVILILSSLGDWSVALVIFATNHGEGAMFKSEVRGVNLGPEK